MPTIDINRASLRFRNKTLFANLSIQFPANQWTCILGSSGVGKSSLLRLIANLPAQTATEYQAEIHASDQLPLAGRIAYMAQKDLLLPWANVLDNTLIGYRLRGKEPAGIRERAGALLNAVGLGDSQHLRPADLSGGMRQRVAIVRTLLEDKPIVLMDEPFSALDAVTRHRLQNLAHELLQDRTVILVTHDPLEALRLGHVIHILAGSPAQIIKTIVPQISPLRDVTHPDLLSLQQQIWQALLAK